jgi:symplekin
LSYLEVESTHNQNSGDKDPFPTIDRSNIETEFELSQKSYALTINAVSMLATNRPTFFKDSATCLARRAIDPPTADTSNLKKAGILTVRSHLKASCLTLLRNSLSITTGAATLLHRALSSDICKMKIQATKAMHMAKQAAHLKTAKRSERNKAAVFYQWDQSKVEEIDDSSKKRKLAGFDALEKMRMAKLARGLGNGIQLPTSMSDACELILLNLSYIPSSRAAVTAKDKKKTQSDQKRKKKMTFDYFVDAIMSNGASLVSDESRWYRRDGGDAWMMEISALVSEDENEDQKMKEKGGSDEKKNGPSTISFTLDTSTLDAAGTAMEGGKTDESKLYSNQCQTAAADAFERILLKTKSARDSSVINFGNELASRLAWSLKDIKPSRQLKNMSSSIENGTESQSSFAKEFPLVSSCLAFDLETLNDSATSESKSNSGEPIHSLSNRVLHEAYIKEIGKNEKKQEGYEKALEFYISTILQSCKKADDKPNDNSRKKLASTAASSLLQQLAVLPYLPTKALELTSGLCDINSVTNKALEASRKSSNQNLSQAASAHGKFTISIISNFGILY